MASLLELLAQAKRTEKQMTPAQLRWRFDSGEMPVLVDVREKDELAVGTLPGALPISRGILEMNIERAVPDRAAVVVLYCAGGNRSLLATETLRRMGYRNAASLTGGFAAWAREGNPIERTEKNETSLTEAQRHRYARHLAIPEVGEKGQEKLLSSRVLLVGVGGLGSPAAYYLAAAGVGHLGIVDYDVVEESNLQRQILHTPARVGEKKTVSAKRTLADFNPGVEVTLHDERLTSKNIDAILERYDLVIDGSDNFPTRYLVNDAAVKLRRPCVHGSVFRFEGQVSVFHCANGGPCYRCLYPQPPPAHLAPSCAEAGVLGVLPGVIGLLQAVETLKLLLHIGTPLVGRMLAYDALAGSFREFRVPRDENCRYCGEGQVFPGYDDYERFCEAPVS